MTNHQLQIQHFVFGPFQTNTYVVSINDEMVNEQMVLVIDPACSNQYEQHQLYTYIESIRRSRSVSETVCQCNGLSGEAGLSLIATHGHLDHLWGAKWATEQWNTPVLMHEADIPMAKAMQQQYELFGIRATPEPFPIESLTDEVGLTVKRSVSETVCQRSGLSILSTPGHTPGSICLYFPNSLNSNSLTPSFLISGDTLFRMGYGRTDLPGGNFGQLISSLERLFELPSDVRVYPGHGEFTTIGAERR